MTTEQARQVLKDNGYYVDNLWHVNDVKDRFECDDKTAQDILHDSLTSDYVFQTIHSAITDYAICDDLKEKNN